MEIINDVLLRSLRWHAKHLRPGKQTGGLIGQSDWDAKYAMAIVVGQVLELKCELMGVGGNGK